MVFFSVIFFFFFFTSSVLRVAAVRLRSHFTQCILNIFIMKYKSICSMFLHRANVNVLRGEWSDIFDGQRQRHQRQKMCEEIHYARFISLRIECMRHAAAVLCLSHSPSVWLGVRCVWVCSVGAHKCVRSAIVQRHAFLYYENKKRRKKCERERAPNSARTARSDIFNIPLHNTPGLSFAIPNVKILSINFEQQLYNWIIRQILNRNTCKTHNSVGKITQRCHKSRL